MNELETNAMNVTISSETKTLIICVAKLNEIFNAVGGLMKERYNMDLSDEFVEAYENFENQLSKIRNDFIDSISIERDFKEI